MALRFTESEMLSQSGSHQHATIYLRNCRGQAKLSTLHTPITNTDLAREASDRWAIPLPRVMLYYNGLRIDNYSGPINLVDSSICHVIDTQNLNTPELQVTFLPPDKHIPPFKRAFLPESTIR